MEKLVDGVAGAAWFIATLATAFSLAGAARRLFPKESPWLTAMHVIVAGWGCLVTVCFVLGTAGMLSVVPLLVGVTLLSATVGGLVHRLTPAPETTQEPLTRVLSPCDGRIWSVIWITVAAVLIAAIVLRAVLRYPEDWDTLMYHLPLVDSWLRTQSLYAPDCPLWYNAANLELVALWQAAPFSGDFWAQMANLPVLLLLGISTWELGRSLELTTGVRNAAALAAITPEAVFRQATSLKNDLAVTALLVAGIAYGLRYAQTGRRGDLWLTAVALGLLPGVKYYALGHAVVAWTGLLPLTGGRQGFRASAKLAAAGAASTIVFAGYWYARNFLVTGTPLYPLGISAPTGRLGTLPSHTWGTTLLGSGNMGLLPQCLNATAELGGPIYVAALGLLPTTMLWLVASAVFKVRLCRDSVGWTRFTLAWLASGSLLVFAVTPFVVDPKSDGRAINSLYIAVRFNLCGLVLVAVAASVLLSDIAKKFYSIAPAAAWIPSAALATAALLSLGQATAVAIDDWLIALLIMADIAMASYVLCRRICSGRASQASVFSAACGGATFLAVCSSLAGQRWHADFSSHYDRTFSTDVFTNLAALEAPRPAIGVFGYRYYPYFGSRREFRVVRPKFISSEGEFFRWLTEERIGMLSLIRRDPFPNGRYVNGPEWVRRHPEVFTPFKHAGDFDVYWVTKLDRHD